MKGKKIVKTVLIVIAVLALVELIALLKLKASVEGYKKHWEKQNSIGVVSGSQLYIAMGDSAAQSIGASQPQKGYVGLIAEGLARKTNKNVQTINLSVSGAKIQDVIDKQIPRLKDFNVDADTIITLDIGGNEMRTFNEADFRLRMEELIRQLPKQTLVADVPYFGGGRYRNLEPRVVQANKIIYDLTQKYDVKMIPLHETTEAKKSIFVNSADLFHPSDKGYRNWYEAFRQAPGI